MQIAKLSKRNYSQMLVIPKEYRIDGEKVKITQYGNGILIEPIDEDHPFAKMFDNLAKHEMPRDLFEQGRESNLLPEERDEIFTWY